MPIDPQLDQLSREELVARARALGARRPEVMTRVELRDEIVRLSEPDPTLRRRSRGWLGVARDLVASVVDSGLNLQGAAAAIRGEPKPETEWHGPPPVATLTLAEIYLTQGHYDRALDVVAEVLASEPDHAAAEALRERIERERATLPGRRRPPAEASGREGDPVTGSEAEAAPTSKPQVESAPEPPVESAPVSLAEPQAENAENATELQAESALEPADAVAAAVVAAPAEAEPSEPPPPEPTSVSAPAPVRTSVPAPASEREVATPAVAEPKVEPAAPALAAAAEARPPASSFPMVPPPPEPSSPAAVPSAREDSRPPPPTCALVLTGETVQAVFELPPSASHPLLRVAWFVPQHDGVTHTELDLPLDPLSNQLTLPATPASAVVRAAVGVREGPEFRPLAVAWVYRLHSGSVDVSFAPPGDESKALRARVDRLATSGA